MIAIVIREVINFFIQRSWGFRSHGNISYQGMWYLLALSVVNKTGFSDAQRAEKKYVCHWNLPYVLLLKRQHLPGPGGAAIYQLSSMERKADLHSIHKPCLFVVPAEKANHQGRK